MSISFTAFSDELVKIAISKDDFLLKKDDPRRLSKGERLSMLPAAAIGLANVINQTKHLAKGTEGNSLLYLAHPAATLATLGAIELRRKLKGEHSSVFRHKYKTAASPAGIGAGMGAGLSAIRSGLNEWDQRSNENKSKITSRVQADRKHRLKRMGVDAALSAAAGGSIAHGGAKLYGKGLDAASKKGRSLTRHAGKVLDKSIDRLGKHFQEPFTGAKAKALGKNLGEGLQSQAKGLGESLGAGLQGKAKEVGEGIIAGVKEKMTPHPPKFFKRIADRLKR